MVRGPSFAGRYWLLLGRISPVVNYVVGPPPTHQRTNRKTVLTERFADILLNSSGTVLHTYPITLSESCNALDDAAYQAKGAESGGARPACSDAELGTLTARMCTARGGQMAPYGDELEENSETKLGLVQAVRERAYLLWEKDGRPMDVRKNTSISLLTSIFGSAPTCCGSSKKEIRKGDRMSIGVGLSIPGSVSVICIIQIDAVLRMRMSPDVSPLHGRVPTSFAVRHSCRTGSSKTRNRTTAAAHRQSDETATDRIDDCRCFLAEAAGSLTFSAYISPHGRRATEAEYLTVIRTWSTARATTSEWRTNG